MPAVYVSAPPTKIGFVFVIWDRAANPKDHRPGAKRSVARRVRVLLGLTLFLLSLSQPHAGTTTVFIDEFHACGFESPLDRVDRAFFEFFTAFESCNRVDRNLGCCREFADAHCQRCASHSRLDGAHNHNCVTILVDSAVASQYRNFVMIS